MNDASILDNLRKRHAKDEIYTYTASVLLAVNPYKEIKGLYGDAQCEEYRGKHIGVMPPHPYAIADSAYRQLNREKKNQALLISGESGAGKTETAKIVVNYLCHTSGAGSGTAAAIQARIQSSQPILESLGNAATLRNSNSSRFGKYIRAFFDGSGSLHHAGIDTYLLESSRVVAHDTRERTYHVFYEMLAGLDEQKLQSFRLTSTCSYRLLNTTATNSKDGQNFKRLVEALKTVGRSEEQIDRSLQILAGLVHLGNLASSEDEHGLPSLEAQADGSEGNAEAQAHVAIDSTSAENAAALLGLDVDELVSTMKRRKLVIPGRNSIHEVARTPSQFRQARDSLIKAIYKRIFEQTVGFINASFHELQGSDTTGGRPSTNAEGTHIGILDIYGFERLQRNSFEQLCINLANERLQQCFVENVLGAEQGLYKREGLEWTELPVPDSKPVVDCIMQVFSNLDDFSHRQARGMERDATDERFCEKVTEENNKDAKKREILNKPQASRGGRRGPNGGAAVNANEGFTIRHYAGHVDYTTRGWLDKNNDRLLEECEELLVTSSNPAVKDIAEESEGKRVLFRSISRKYTQDLDNLLQTLTDCNMHYIRCFKPTEEQQPGMFQQQLVLNQIVQCGTIELVKIMHDGFPNRCDLQDLLKHFKDMLPESFQRYGARTFIEALMLAYKVPKDEYAVGLSRLFLKSERRKALEDMRDSGCMASPDELKAIVRGIIRKKWVRAIHAVRICLYVPKLARQVRVRRALKATFRASLLAAFLSKRLRAARGRIAARRLAARRRLISCFQAVRLSVGFWRTIKEKRQQRLYKALSLGARVLKFSARWVAIARERIVERAENSKRLQEAQREVDEKEKKLREERRLFNEQKRIEEEDRKKREMEFEAELKRRREADEQLRKERAEEGQDELKKQAEDLEKKAAQALAEKDAAQKEVEKMRYELACIQEKKKKESANSSGSREASEGDENLDVIDSTNDGDDDDISPQDSISVVPARDPEAQAEMEELRKRTLELERQLAEKNNRERERRESRARRMSTSSVSSSLGGRSLRVSIGGAPAGLADGLAPNYAEHRRMSVIALKAEHGISHGQEKEKVDKYKREFNTLQRRNLMNDLYNFDDLCPGPRARPRLQPVEEISNGSLPEGQKHDELAATAAIPSPCRDRRSGASNKSVKSTPIPIDLGLTTDEPEASLGEGC
jgi:myosin heavy subunit